MLAADWTAAPACPLSVIGGTDAGGADNANSTFLSPNLLWQFSTGPPSLQCQHNYISVKMSRADLYGTQSISKGAECAK